MKYSFPYITRQSLLIVLVGIAYTIMQTIAIQGLLPYRFGMVLLKSALDAVILAGIGWGAYIVIPSSNYVKLDAAQQVINMMALGIIVILLWTTLFYATSIMVFGKDSEIVVKPILPMVAFLGILLYTIVVQRILHATKQNEKEDAGSFNEPVKGITKPVLPVSSEQEPSNENGPLERVVVRSGQKIHVILVPEIIYIQSDRDYVQIVSDHGKFLKEETMKYFEANLPETLFVRVHRSYIVHIEKIARIEAYGKQNQLLILKNGDKIKASVAGYKLLRDALGL